MNALKKQNDDKLLVTYVDLLLVLLVASLFFVFSLCVSLPRSLSLSLYEDENGKYSYLYGTEMAKKCLGNYLYPSVKGAPKCIISYNISKKIPPPSAHSAPRSRGASASSHPLLFLNSTTAHTSLSHGTGKDGWE